MEKLKVASNNVSNIKAYRKVAELEDEEQDQIKNLYTWSKLNEFLEGLGTANMIEGGMVILRTSDGDIRSTAINMSEDEFISTLEEVKFRRYLKKHFEDMI